MASHTLQDAVLRNLQVMAASTQRLSEAVKATQPGAFRHTTQKGVKNAMRLDETCTQTSSVVMT